MARPVALVTGGSRGIGFAIAKQLHADGWHVALTSRCLSRAEESAASISPEVVGLAYSASDSGNAAAVVKQVAERFASPISGLVNAAGETHNSLVLRLREEDAQRMVETNLLGPLWMSKAVAKSMLPHRKGTASHDAGLMFDAGSIVTIGSVVGSRGNVGQTAYSLSKAGLVGMTTSLAKELGPKNIRVNLIEPGFIATEMTAHNMSEDARNKTLDQIVLNRFGSAQDVADLAAFLLGDRSAYITGQVLRVDGGLVL